MTHFVGLDVSVQETAVCVVDEAGKVVFEHKVATEPDDLVGLLTAFSGDYARIGIEAGPLSQWLVNGLAEAGLPVICVETRHMNSLLKAQQVNKSDRHDARSIAQMMRVGLFKPVHVKTLASQEKRMLLTSRKLTGALPRGGDPRELGGTAGLLRRHARLWHRSGRGLDRSQRRRLCRRLSRQPALDVRRQEHCRGHAAALRGRLCRQLRPAGHPPACRNHCAFHAPSDRDAGGIGHRHAGLFLRSTRLGVCPALSSALIMWVCPNCAASTDVPDTGPWPDGWTCSSCSLRVDAPDGIPLLAPELIGSESGYDPVPPVPACCACRCSRIWIMSTDG